VSIECIRCNIAYWRETYRSRGADISFRCALVGSEISAAIGSVTAVDGLPIYHNETSKLDYLITRDGFYLMMMDRTVHPPVELSDADRDGGTSEEAGR
jgi:hypothetical protein